MKNDNLFISLTSSIAFHLLILSLCLIGLPSSFKHLSNDEQIITFEMLPMSEISNIPVISQNTEIIKEQEEAKKVQENKKPEIPQEIKEEPKDQETLEPEEKEAEIIPEKKKEEHRKEESIKPQTEKPKEIKPKEKEKIKKKKNNNDLESLLKNLEKSSKGDKAKSNKTKEYNENGKENSKGTFNEDLPLSISEKALIKRQIETNWKIPIGAENIEQIKIIAYIALNKDGSVLQVMITEKKCDGVSNTVCNLFADSCIRAVWQSSPIEGLPQDRHNIWKEFNFLFDPTDMVR